MSRGVLREALLLALGFLPLAIVARLATLMQSGALAFEPRLFLSFQEDFLALLLFVATGLALGGFFPRSVRLQALLQATLLLLFGLVLIGALRYRAVYELNFDWSHLQHVEGGETWTSLKSELSYDLLLPLALLFLFVFVWIRQRLHQRSGEGETTHDASRLASRAPWRELGARALCVLLLAGAATGGTLLSGAMKDSTRERSDLQANVPLRLALGPLFRNTNALAFGASPAGASSAGASSAGASSAGASSAGGPFVFRFPTDSLDSQKRLPRVDFPGRGRKFNIVLYFFEGTTADYIGQKINGKSVTPTWDRLFQNGIRMTNHHAQNPLTINALYSVLTSAYDLPNDRWAVRDFPDIKLNSLPEILKANGYRTALFHTGFFDYARQRAFLKNRKFDIMLDEKELRKRPYHKTLNWGIDDRALLEPALKFARAKDRRPFFLVMLPVTPHHPYDIPDDSFKLVEFENKPRLKDRWRAKYLNALYFSDRVLGDFIKSLEAEGLDKNTLFFVFADHGEAFGQHRRNLNHPFFIYQENVHVPFVIYNRALFSRPLVYSRLGRHIDIAPTVLDVLGLPPDPRHEGLSLFRAGPPRLAPFRTTWRNDLLGARDAQWKYIVNLKSGDEELYDLSSDPEEKENRIRRYPAVGRRYHEYLIRLQAYKRRFYETVLGRSVDWTLTQEKD